MSTTHRITVILLLAGLLAVCAFGCDKNQTDTAADAAEAVADTAAAEKPAQEINMGETQKPPTLAGSHILIAYKGAMRAAETVTRSKEEAQKLATDLAKEVAKDPSKLEEMAKKFSDGPTGAKGGDLGFWKKGMMVPEFDVAIEKMKVGEATAEPVETGFGFHIIRRNQAIDSIEVTAYHILISYKGAARARGNVTRSKEEAQKLAGELSAKLKAAPDSFETVAKENSDDPRVKMPIWTTGEGMLPDLDKAVLALKVGQVGDVVETPFGFHIFQRLEPVHGPKMAASHILIQFKGAENAPESITRNEAEAKKLAEEIIAEAKKEGADFAKLAMRRSEDPSAIMNAGALGVWEQGNMLPSIEEALTKVKVDEVAGPVKSAYGFHVLMRTDPEKATPPPGMPQMQKMPPKGH